MLAPRGPSTISAVAELVTIPVCYLLHMGVDTCYYADNKFCLQNDLAQPLKGQSNGDKQHFKTT